VPLSQSPRYEPPEVEPFTEADASRVLDTAAGRRNSARWSVALALGLWQGEALGLRWTDVDLDEARVVIRVQLFHPPWQHGCFNAEGQPTCHKDPGRCPDRFGGQPVLMPVKSKAGRRTLSLPFPLADQLRRQSASQAAERLRTGCRWQNHGLVFAREDGAPIRKETDSAEWHRILRLAGVRHGRLHDARHTAATLGGQVGHRRAPVVLVLDAHQPGPPGGKRRVAAAAGLDGGLLI
jgi:integrase